MIKYLTSAILIGISVTVFLFFTKSLYTSIQDLRAQQSIYNEALNNSKDLENERDKLTAKYNAISLDDLARIKKLLPDSVDNIRLILEIERLALPYGMVLKDVQYNAAQSATTNGAVAVGGSGREAKGGYGSWDLEFSVTGTYNNFINFTKTLENNLRIVDISSIQFASASGIGLNKSGTETYRFAYKIKTYWLKN